MRPLHYQGRLPRSGLRLLDIFVKPTSACSRQRIVWLASSSACWACAAAYAKATGPAWAPRSREPGVGALMRAESLGGGGGALPSAGGGS